MKQKWLVTKSSFGDWFRNSNPTEYPTGKVQIFNFANNTWYNGTPMPSSQERGLGGMAEAGGYLYYAGGVRNLVQQMQQTGLTDMIL